MDLKAKVRDIHAIGAKIDKLRLKICCIEDEIRRELATQYRVATIELGSWDCPDSPTGRCFYDSDKDGCLDSCLVCGYPDERK